RPRALDLRVDPTMLRLPRRPTPKTSPARPVERTVPGSDRQAPYAFRLLQGDSVWKTKRAKFQELHERLERFEARHAAHVDELLDRHLAIDARKQEACAMTQAQPANLR